jgi:opacity protein-like surface antigen
MKISRFTKSSSILAVSFLAFAASAFAQDKRVEINPFFGYTFGDGVTVNPILIGGEIYNAVNTTDGYAFGIHFGVFVTENVEVGFLWARQDSVLEVEGTTTTELATMPISNYHGTFTYNFGESDAQARPFVFGGLGATTYSPEDVNGVSVDGESQFSSTWGGGVKIYPSPNVGVSVMARFTPTYIKSDPAGYWCGYYGCYTLVDTQYANQFEFSGGVSFRF